MRAIQGGGRIVGKGLGKALAAFEGPLAFLDFETVRLLEKLREIGELACRTA